MVLLLALKSCWTVVTEESGQVPASVGSGRASWREKGSCGSQRPLQQVGTLQPKDVTKSESTQERETN